VYDGPSSGSVDWSGSVKDRITTYGVIGKLAISLIAVVVIQGILAYRIRVFGYFDLPLILSIYYGFTLGRPVPSVIIGTSIGLLQDSLSGMPMGTNGFSKTLIGYLAATAGSKFDVDLPVTRAIAIFLFTVGDGFIISILGLMTGSSANLGYNVFWNWGVAGVFNALLGILMFGYHDRVTHAAS
jgi:rod shape-determining protein MreD